MVKLPRIGLVSHFPPPPGGMPGQAQLLVKNLTNEGIKVIPIRTNLGDSSLSRALNAIRFLRTMISWTIFLYRLYSALPKVDVLHIFSHSGLSFFLFTLPSVVLGRWFRKRIILHYHGGGAEEFIRRWQHTVQWVFQKPHVLLVPSGYLQDVFRRFGLEAKVIPNICHLERFYRKHEDKQLKPSFIVARHLEKIYNVECIIRAFELIWKRYPEATLLIVGSGSEEDRLKKLVQEKGMSKAVTFLGYVENEQMGDIYSQVSIFLNASNVDNMPVSIIEAFAAGLPVVTTRAGGIPYLVKDNKTGLLVDLNDYNGIAEKVFLLLENHELNQNIVKNARKVIEEYRWPEVYKRLLTVYQPKNTL